MLGVQPGARYAAQRCVAAWLGDWHAASWLQLGWASWARSVVSLLCLPCSKADIKKAFFQKAKQHHPDM